MAKRKKKETVVIVTEGGKQQCPQGYTWNGTKCVKDVG